MFWRAKKKHCLKLPRYKDGDRIFIHADTAIETSPDLENTVPVVLGEDTTVHVQYYDKRHHRYVFKGADIGFAWLYIEECAKQTELLPILEAREAPRPNARRLSYSNSGIAPGEAMSRSRYVSEDLPSSAGDLTNIELWRKLLEAAEEWKPDRAKIEKHSRIPFSLENAELNCLVTVKKSIVCKERTGQFAKLHSGSKYVLLRYWANGDIHLEPYKQANARINNKYSGKAFQIYELDKTHHQYLSLIEEPCHAWMDGDASIVGFQLQKVQK